jgi:GNAT superfamily N-acetyltransferase
VLPAHKLQQAFQQAFADYLIGPFDLPLAHWPRFLARQGVDLRLSRVALDDESIVAFALVAPRRGRWRLATMGAVPTARGGGMAPALLDDLIARAGAQGVPGLELEVFAQNERALRLYRSRGFDARHELHGYEGIGVPDPAQPLGRVGVEVDLASAFAWLDEAVAQVGDVPLQVTPASLAVHPSGLKGWRLGTAQIVFGPDAHGGTVVHSLLDRQPGQRDAEALVQSLRAHVNGGVIKVPPLQRTDLGGDALRRAGMRVQPLHQLLMVRPA